MNRSIVVVLLGSLLTVSLVHSVVAQGEAKQVPMAKCEYKVVHATQLAENEPDLKQIVGALDKKFNEFAADGWEFEHEMDGILVFRRDK